MFVNYLKSLSLFARFGIAKTPIESALGEKRASFHLSAPAFSTSVRLAPPMLYQLCERSLEVTKMTSNKIFKRLIPMVLVGAVMLVLAMPMTAGAHDWDHHDNGRHNGWVHRGRDDFHHDGWV